MTVPQRAICSTCHFIGNRTNVAPGAWTCRMPHASTVAPMPVDGPGRQESAGASRGPGDHSIAHASMQRPSESPGPWCQVPASHHAVPPSRKRSQSAYVSSGYRSSRAWPASDSPLYVACTGCCGAAQDVRPSTAIPVHRARVRQRGVVGRRLHGIAGTAATIVGRRWPLFASFATSHGASSLPPEDF